MRTALLRTGIVLTPQGGALKKQLPLFKLALGGKFGLNPSDRSRISMPEAKPVDEFSAFLAAKAVNE